MFLHIWPKNGSSKWEFMEFLNVCYSAAGNWFQVNEVLNVADLAAHTITKGAATTDAGKTTTQAAITAIVNKINEIIKKSTISNC